MQRFLQLLLTIGLSTLLAACGGGSGGSNEQLASGGATSTAPTGDNVAAISVNGGAFALPNIAYTSVTVCYPGSTTQCQTINNVMIDTGSTGLRVLASALNGLSLPQQQLVAGHTLAECIPFLDGSYMWGPVRTADVKIGGKIAQSVRIQIAADSSYGTAPATCLKNSNPAVTPLEIATAQDLGGNAILGVGHFSEDCGTSCLNPQNDYYYDCTTTASCVETAADTTRQVQNPVAVFASDNNGVVIQLPAISNNGATRADGWMIFGINTRDNNMLGSAQVFTVDNGGYLTTTYSGSDQTASFIDSGSNALYFTDDSIPQCQDFPPFFCPASTLHLSATIRGQNNVSSPVSFNVANTDSLNGNANAFSNLAAYSLGDFDWGLPFFFGRKVYTALETNPGGPYVAF